jgi:hypothetical protein
MDLPEMAEKENQSNKNYFVLIYNSLYSYFFSYHKQYPMADSSRSALTVKPTFQM